MKRIIAIAFVLLSLHVHAQSWSEKMAKTVMTLWKDSFAIKPGRPAGWSYDQGVILKGFEGIWQRTGDAQYYNYIKKSMDFYVSKEGTIKGYKTNEHNIDHLNNGKLLLLLYRVTGEEKYLKASTLLRDQLRTHPRTTQGGFWHKEVYPWQMWLDGLYMGQPFYAEYSYITHDDTAFNDITRQFILMERNSIDTKTGLLYHGWDESKKQKWANPQTGTSPNFWGRSVGWYAMALVDALDYIPEDHPQRRELIAILNRLSTAVLKVQDPKNGLWYDVLDKRGSTGNYVEASASSMIVYALAKGARKGYLPQSIMKSVKKGYDGIIKQFIETDANGQVNLKGTVSVSGLGGNPYRDGSYEYYLSEPVIVNDPKGIGAFLLASNEIEMLPTLKIGKNKNIFLDYYFNHEEKKDFTGTTVQHHYVWDQMDNNGFSLLGNIFNRYGVTTNSLKDAPTADNLRRADIYLIVDPDNAKESKNPNYMQPNHVEEIYNWVKKGGVLLLFANDSSNVELTHFNTLVARFGIQFNANKPRNMVKGTDFPTGTFVVPNNNPILKTAGKVYLKEISPVIVTKPAKAVLSEGGDDIIAVAKIGKGTVFAVGDPWIYNEYIDGRKLPAELENFKAAEDIVKWAIRQSKK